MPCQENECDQWPGSHLDHLATVSHTIPCVSFIALIKSLAFVLGEVGTAVGVGTLRYEYFPFLFVSHSYLATSWTATLYSVSEMAIPLFRAPGS